MEALLALFFSLVALATFDVAALRWGNDSRPGVGDDHRR